MFLNALTKQNLNLIKASVSLFNQGHLLPDTYVIDVDTFVSNANKIKQQADRNGIKLYAMTKQFGRNPYLAKLLVEEVGYEGIVCVDYREALFFHKCGVKVSHVGHLVQPPHHTLDIIVNEIQPEVITITSIEKAQAISKVAHVGQKTQGIILKFYREDDVLYVNQESGFPLSQLDEIVSTISELPNIKICGVTHFPCFLTDDENRAFATPNTTTLKVALNKLGRLIGKVLQVNMPSLSSCETIPMIANLGGTHAEPGHALTGTTPSNSEGTQPERVAMLYLSEVSHHFSNVSYCFGGGYYRRGNMRDALVYTGDDLDPIYAKVSNDDTSSIDYHLKLDSPLPIGSAVIMAFRTQIFVTRSHVALVSGVDDQPKLIGLYDAQGNEV